MISHKSTLILGTVEVVSLSATTLPSSSWSKSRTSTSTLLKPERLPQMFYGFEPKNQPNGETRRSYTQLEYNLGKEQRRQVFRFIARPDYQPGDCVKPRAGTSYCVKNV